MNVHNQRHKSHEILKFITLKIAYYSIRNFKLIKFIKVLVVYKLCKFKRRRHSTAKCIFLFYQSFVVSNKQVFRISQIV